MRKYLSFFRVRFSNSLQYRAAALAGVITQLAWGTLELLLYRAFYESDPASFPMGFEQLSAYIWFKEALLAMFMTWYFESDIFNAITSGGVAYELIRPMNIYSMWFIKSMANRLSKTVLRSLPILLVAALLPKPYGLNLPASPAAFAMFFVTLIIAFLVTVSYCMLVYIIAFYTLDSMGVRIVFGVLADIFSGAYVPLPFMPPTLRRIVELTPFAAMQNVPFRIYSGNIAGAQMWQTVILQVLWLVVLYGGGRLWMRHALGRVVVQGG